MSHSAAAGPGRRGRLSSDAVLVEQRLDRGPRLRHRQLPPLDAVPRVVAIPVGAHEQGDDQGRIALEMLAHLPGRPRRHDDAAEVEEGRVEVRHGAEVWPFRGLPCQPGRYDCCAMGVLDKLLRVGEGKKLKALASLVPDVNALEPELQALSDDALRGKTGEFRRAPRSTARISTIS